jgi:hypothetical protein
MKSSEDLFERAQRAYERGRIAKGVRTAAFVLPLLFVSFGWCGKPSTSCAIALVLAVLTTVLVWRGGVVARAVGPGFVAGIAPLMIPVAMCPSCSTSGMPAASSLLACAAGGALSGAAVVYFATRERQERATFVLAAGAVAVLAGSLGCVIVGLTGILAMMVGLIVVTPVALRSPA